MNPIIFEPVNIPRLRKFMKAIRSLPFLHMYYPLNEPSGPNAYNYAANQLPAVVIGPTQGVKSIAGKAYSFDGVNDVCNVFRTQNHKNARQITIGAIVEVNDTASIKHIYWEDRAGNTTVPRVALAITASEEISLRIKTAFSDGAEAAIVSTPTLSTGPNFIIATVDVPSETFVIYINGVPVAFTGTTTMTNNSLVASDPDTNPRIGAGITGGSVNFQFMNGKIQHLFSTKSVLTPAQVLKLVKLAGFQV